MNATNTIYYYPNYHCCYYHYYLCCCGCCYTYTHNSHTADNTYYYHYDPYSYYYSHYYLHWVFRPAVSLCVPVGAEWRGVGQGVAQGRCSEFEHVSKLLVHGGGTVWRKGLLGGVGGASTTLRPAAPVPVFH